MRTINIIFEEKYKEKVCEMLDEFSSESFISDHNNSGNGIIFLKTTAPFIWTAKNILFHA